MSFAILELNFSCLILNSNGSLSLAKRVSDKFLPEFYRKGLVVKDTLELERFLDKTKVVNLEPISSFDVPNDISLKLFLHSQFSDEDIYTLFSSLKLYEPGGVARLYEFISNSTLPRGDFDLKLVSESYFNRFYEWMEA